MRDFAISSEIQLMDFLQCKTDGDLNSGANAHRLPAKA